MAVYSAGTRVAAATDIRPCFSIYSGPGTISPSILEIGVSTTVGTASLIALCRLTVQGTVGAAVPARSLSQMSSAPVCTPFAAHTGGTPALVDLGYRWTLGASIGSGIIWTFQPDEVQLIPAVSNGFGIYTPVGTGQALDIYMKWLE